MGNKLHKIKIGILKRSTNPKSILFHIVGIICIIWFLIRVVPKPDRIRYPCQQMSITVASGYITFWVILWSTIFLGLNTWMKKIRYNASKFSPVIAVSLVIVFSVSSNVFADIYVDQEGPTRWDPIPKEPIGTPVGVNPG